MLWGTVRPQLTPTTRPVSTTRVSSTFSTALIAWHFSFSQSQVATSQRPPKRLCLLRPNLQTLLWRFSTELPPGHPRQATSRFPRPTDPFEHASRVFEGFWQNCSNFPQTQNDDRDADCEGCSKKTSGTTSCASSAVVAISLRCKNIIKHLFDPKSFNSSPLHDV